MKKIIIKNYGLIVALLFIINNVVLNEVRISGILYILMMLLLIVLNAIIIVRNKDEIKYKSLIIIFFLILLFAKDIWNLLFYISNIITFMLVGIAESKYIQKAIILSAIIFILFIPYIFLLTISIILNDVYGNTIYEDTHYFCENNYEIYSYSAGAMDKFHYNIGKHYEILNIDGIISITYSEINEQNKSEYDKYIKEYDCQLVGEISEFK